MAVVARSLVALNFGLEKYSTVFSIKLKSSAEKFESSNSVFLLLRGKASSAYFFPQSIGWKVFERVSKQNLSHPMFLWFGNG